jgi:hypothetical protein
VDPSVRVYPIVRVYPDMDMTLKMHAATCVARVGPRVAKLIGTRSGRTRSGGMKMRGRGGHLRRCERKRRVSYTRRVSGRGSLADFVPCFGAAEGVPG